MKNFNVTSMLVMLMFMCITSMQAQSITPSKKYITKELNNVSNFSSIRVLGSPDVEYRQSSDSKTTVSIYGSDNLVDLLEVSTVNGVLQVNIKKGVKILSGERRLKVIASSPSLDDANAISEDGTEEEPEIDASLPTLLLVEDNKDLCQLIKLQLEDKFNIHIANNGVEGLKKVHLYHPDIVVTDQMMPEMDGLEMLQSIRKDFQISHIPVIILTAKNDEGAKTKAITLGANAYITKPFSKEYLLARIDQLLAERKLFRERIRQQMENQTTTEEDSYEQFLVKKDVQFLEKIHQVIEENMDDSDFNIDTIASGIGLSRSAFFKKLKSLTGLAPVDLVKEIRLNKSIELIKNTDLSVSEIAFAVGFKDSGYYSKCFRKKYNQSPREYMNEWRKGER